MIKNNSNTRHPFLQRAGNTGSLSDHLAYPSDTQTEAQRFREWLKQYSNLVVKLRLKGLSPCHQLDDLFPVCDLIRVRSELEGNFEVIYSNFLILQLRKLRPRKSEWLLYNPFAPQRVYLSLKKGRL